MATNPIESIDQDIHAEPMVLQMGPSHPATHGTVRFTLDPSDAGGLRTLEKVFQLDLEIAGALPSGRLGTRVHVRFDHGSEPLADQWFRQETIVRLFEQDLVADVSYYLVCNKDRANYPAVRELEAWILENFAEDA